MEFSNFDSEIPVIAALDWQAIRRSYSILGERLFMLMRINEDLELEKRPTYYYLKSAVVLYKLSVFLKTVKVLWILNAGI